MDHTVHWSHVLIPKHCHSLVSPLLEMLPPYVFWGRVEDAARAGWERHQGLPSPTSYLGPGLTLPSFYFFFEMCPSLFLLPLSTPFLLVLFLACLLSQWLVTSLSDT